VLNSMVTKTLGFRPNWNDGKEVMNWVVLLRNVEKK
jgi:hypothetical protein